MKLRSIIRASAIGSTLAFSCSPLFAGANDYRFEAVTTDVKGGENTELAVKLTHTPSGKPVTNAVIFRTRLDMSPDSMDEMEAKHQAMPASEPGVYRFTADLTMAGGWALKLQAKVPGESETIEGSVVFKAKE